MAPGTHEDEHGREPALGRLCQPADRDHRPRHEQPPADERRVQPILRPPVPAASDPAGDRPVCVEAAETRAKDVADSDRYEEGAEDGAVGDVETGREGVGW
jgi:hypothetical protein